MISWRPSESFWTIADDGTVTVSLGHVINRSKGEAELAGLFEGAREITLPVDFFVRYLLDDPQLTSLEKTRAILATRSARHIKSLKEFPDTLREREKSIIIAAHARRVQRWGPASAHWDLFWTSDARPYKLGEL